MSEVDIMPEKTDAQWAAESDARTLAESFVILDDEKRLSAAKKAAVKMVAKEIKESQVIAERMQGLLDLAGRNSETVQGMKIIK